MKFSDLQKAVHSQSNGQVNTSIELPAKLLGLRKIHKTTCRNIIYSINNK